MSKGNCFSIHESFAFFPHLWRQTPTPTHRTAQPQEEFVCCLGGKMKKKMTCRTCVLSFLPHSLPPLLPHSDSPALPPASLLPSLLPCLLRCVPVSLPMGTNANAPHRTVPGRGNIFPRGRTCGPNFFSGGQPSATSNLEK